MTETSFLKWVVGSVVIICSAQTCRGWGSTDGVHAIVTNFSVHPTDGLLTNITSLLLFITLMNLLTSLATAQCLGFQKEYDLQVSLSSLISVYVILFSIPHTQTRCGSGSLRFTQ